MVVRWKPDGTASVVAGNGIPGYSGDGGLAINASLSSPADVAFDRSGNLYIADSGNQRVRKVATDGTITTIAGTGTAGFTGDNGPAVNARFNNPSGVVVDSSGNVYVADAANYRIRQIGTNGLVATVAGNGKPGYAGEGVAAQVAVDVAGQMAFDSNAIFISAIPRATVRRLAPDEIRPSSRETEPKG